MKQILHLVPFQNLIFLFFDSDLLFPRIRASQASFKAVLIAVYMTYGLMIDDCLFVAARFDEIKQRFSEMHFVAQATSTVQV